MASQIGDYKKMFLIMQTYLGGQSLCSPQLTPQIQCLPELLLAAIGLVFSAGSYYLSMHSWPSTPIFLPIAIFLCRFVPPFWVSLSVLCARKLLFLFCLFLDKNLNRIDLIIPTLIIFILRDASSNGWMGGGGGGGGSSGGIGSGRGSGGDGGEGQWQSWSR